MKRKNVLDIIRGGNPTYRIVPITKPICIMARVPADHRDEGVHHQPQHKEDLEYRHVKLGNTKIPHGKPIENSCVTSQRRPREMGVIVRTYR